MNFHKLVSKHLIFIIIVSFILLGIFVSRASLQPGSHNDISRLAGIIAVSRHNEFTIDNTIQEPFTVDKVSHNDIFYSSKPPTINVLGGIITKIVFQVKPVLLENDIAIYRFNTILFVILPLILIFISFIYLLSSSLEGMKKRYYFFSLFLIFGTLLFSFSRHLNNHVLGALLQLMVFFLIFHSPIRKSKLYYLLIGLLLGFLFSIDITFGFISVPISLIFLYIINKPKLNELTYLILGLIPFTFIHFYLNYMQFGTLLPPQLLPEKYLSYEGSNWIGLEDDGIEATNHNVFLRTFNYLFGTYGLFLYQPLLLLAFLSKSHWKRKDFRYMFAISIGVLVFNIITTPNYGGSSFGPRRLIPLIPMIYYFVVLTLSNFKNWNIFIKILVILVFIINFGFSYLGYINTWETWNYYTKEDGRQLFFPLLYTIRKVLRWHNLDYLLLYIIK